MHGSNHALRVGTRWSLRDAAGRELPQRLTELLRLVGLHGNLMAACRAIGLDYRQGWDWVRDGERVLAAPLLERERGKGSRLTPLAWGLIRIDDLVDARVGGVLQDLHAQLQAGLSSVIRFAEPEPESTDDGAAEAPPGLVALLGRRSVSPKRLAAPAPTRGQVALMLQAALRAPDHGGLRPWRVVEFLPRDRAALADAFEAEKRRRDPLASELDLQRAREHATRPPALLAFVVSPHARGTTVPLREQWLAAGAALGNLLNAAHQLGFGAILLSGERCFEPQLLAQLGVLDGEALAGFISLGSVVNAPPAAAAAPVEERWSAWTPARALSP